MQRLPIAGEALRSALAGVEHLVILGPMGVGKTTLGRLLAGRLELPFTDSDQALSRNEHATARELQKRRGQAALHSLESALLLEALAKPQRQVISAAASTIDDDRCLAALARPPVLAIWLHADPATIASRYRSATHRPPPVTDAVTRRREARWASLDPIRLDTTGASPAELLEVALAAIAARHEGPERSEPRG